jgi:acetyl-CoA carboxylase biotin carboxyl carrier protein
MSENIGSAKAKEQNKAQTRASGKKGASPKKTVQASEPSLNMAELQELANLVDQHGFTDFEFENENIRVRLSKNPAPQIFQAAQQYAPQSVASSTPIQSPTASTENKSETVAAETSADENLHTITSPIVGTFYRSPAPDKEPYVKEGSNVSPDTIVCIVEAMKLMNEIEAEVAGEVVKIYVESGQPVEYGQPLFGIKK